MESSDWEQIQEIYYTVSEMPVDQRSAYLDKTCSGKEQLRKEVESLLSARDDNNGFMEASTVELGFEVMLEKARESAIGSEVGPYKIIKALGRGGMGEVFLAEDTVLGRKVALKFLFGEVVGDNWAKRQLRKEAQAVAVLDHPNICPVYGIEEHDGRSFIVMQYVEGDTLAELIRKGPIPTDQILALAKQIVSAIAEAHSNGIIHRDIKPKNIMVTPAGQVKVLDFGLAKTIQPKGGESLTDSISHLSQSGLVPGTVAYMSPEQLKGEKLDYRSDIFSVGTVLYEAVTGRNPFTQTTNAETISAILTTTPPEFRKSTSQKYRELDPIVQRCLEKPSNNRYPSAGALLLDLESLSSPVDVKKGLGKYLTVRAALAFAIVLLVFVVATFIYFRLTRENTVAVLPIVNESGDPSLEYLGDGLTESIINKLTGLQRLRVKPRTLVAGYKGQSIDAVKIGNDLKVDGVLVGKITGDKNLPILAVTLVSSADGGTLWTQQYSLELEKVFAVETEVSQKVTSHLEVRSGEDLKRIERAREPQNPEARREYWLGRYYWRNRDNNNSLLQAISHFEEAIRLAPEYARAHAGLADCYAFGNVVAYGQMDTKEAMSRAERAAKDALDLDDELPEAYTSLATVNVNYYWNWNEAESRFRRAIQLNPDYAPARYGYSRLLTMRQRANESISEGEIAKSLDPFSPAIALNYCRTFYFARRFGEATGCYERLVRDQPNYNTGQYSLGLMHLQQGRFSEALQIFERLYEKDKRLAGAVLGYTYGIRGREADAKRILAEIRALPNLPPQEIGLIYIGLGDVDTALVWLEQSAEQHFAPFAFLAVDPMFEKLQEDSRFVALARRYNLPTTQ